MIPYIQTRDGMTVFINGASVVVPKDAPNFQDILDAIFEDASTETILALTSVSRKLFAWSEGSLTVTGETVSIDGRELSPRLNNRILTLVKSEVPNKKAIAALQAFATNLLENPSRTAVNELYDFLDACNLPITPDGHFLAYKKVRGTFFDCHSNSFDNTPGNTLSVPRNTVDEDRNRTCSSGLHVCSYGYLSHFGSSDEDDRVVICKINPKDVVAVPADYDNMKMRVSQYTVVDEVPNREGETLTSWVTGNKPVNWIHDTINDLKALVTQELGVVDPKVSSEVFYNTTELTKNKFLLKVATLFALTNGLASSSADSIVEKFDGYTIRDILVWVSNYTE